MNGNDNENQGPGPDDDAPRAPAAGQITGTVTGTVTITGGEDGAPAVAGVDPNDPRVRAALDRYWRSNLRIMAGLLLLWASVSFGCGILWADSLNAISLPGSGFPLGFWFAQQGSIAVFVICILVYCIAMNRLDRRHHEELEAIGRGD